MTHWGYRDNQTTNQSAFVPLAAPGLYFVKVDAEYTLNIVFCNSILAVSEKIGVFSANIARQARPQSCLTVNFAQFLRSTRYLGSCTHRGDYSVCFCASVICRIHFIHVF